MEPIQNIQPLQIGIIICTGLGVAAFLCGATGLVIELFTGGL